MKTTLAFVLATTTLAGAVQAQDITEFRIGILGGENAQDRMNSNECVRLSPAATGFKDWLLPLCRSGADAA